MQRIILVALFSTLVILFTAAQRKPSQKGKGPDKATMERGKKVYDTYCLACHQADGTGVPSMNPPLVKTKWVSGDKKKLIGIIVNGMNEEIEINGEVYSNAMPAHAHLSDQQVADVLTFIRNNFNNKGSVVSASEVKTVRSASK